ncbi:MAG: DMT family transporter [Bacteroidales bacterium]
MNSPRLTAYVSVILAMMFWGFTFVLYKYANLSFRPTSIIFFRLFISIFFLFGFAFLFRRLKKISPKDQKWFLLMALFEPFIYFLGEANGMTIVTPTVGAIIVSTIPLIVPFGAWLFFKEKLTLFNQVGLVVSFAGVLMVILTKSGGLSAEPAGILLMFLAVAGAVGYTLIAKKLLEDYNPITITAYQSFYGLLMFTPLFLVTELPDFDPSGISTPSLLAVLYLGIVGSGICFILLNIAMRELGAARANIFANIVPVVAALVSFLMLGEPMPVLKILGIAVTLIGLIMSQSSGLKVRRGIRRNGMPHPPYS